MSVDLSFLRFCEMWFCQPCPSEREGELEVEGTGEGNLPPTNDVTRSRKVQRRNKGGRKKGKGYDGMRYLVGFRDWIKEEERRGR